MTPPLQGQQFAMKCLRKHVILERNHTEMVFRERNLLARLRHPRLVNMHYAFQDDSHLYIVMDACMGGDLHYQIMHTPTRRFTEDQARFYAVCILQALQYMHSRGVLHRDIKPENLLLDSKGQLRVTDLGVSGELDASRVCTSTSGTRPYMAPEVFMSGHRHGPASDLYSLGITLHQFLTGQRPYRASRANLKTIVRMAAFVPPDSVKTRDHARRVLASAQERRAASEEFAISRRLRRCSPDCVDFVRSLLICNPDYRLGATGFREVFDHPWLATADIDGIFNETSPAPFVPDVSKSQSDVTDSDLARLLLNNGDSTPTGATLLPEEQARFEGYDFNTSMRDAAELHAATYGSHSKTASPKAHTRATETLATATSLHSQRATDSVAEMSGMTSAADATAAAAAAVAAVAAAAGSSSTGATTAAASLRATRSSAAPSMSMSGPAMASSQPPSVRAHAIAGEADATTISSVQSNGGSHPPLLHSHQEPSPTPSAAPAKVVAPGSAVALSAHPALPPQSSQGHIVVSRSSSSRQVQDGGSSTPSSAAGRGLGAVAAASGTSEGTAGAHRGGPTGRVAPLLPAAQVIDNTDSLRPEPSARSNSGAQPRSRLAVQAPTAAEARSSQDSSRLRPTRSVPAMNRSSSSSSSGSGSAGPAQSSTIVPGALPAVRVSRLQAKASGSGSSFQDSNVEASSGSGSSSLAAIPPPPHLVASGVASRRQPPGPVTTGEPLGSGQSASLTSLRSPAGWSETNFGRAGLESHAGSFLAKSTSTVRSVGVGSRQHHPSDIVSLSGSLRHFGGPGDSFMLASPVGGGDATAGHRSPQQQEQVLAGAAIPEETTQTSGRDLTALAAVRPSSPSDGADLGEEEQAIRGGKLLQVMMASAPGAAATVSASASTAGAGQTSSSSPPPPAAQQSPPVNA